MTKAQWDVRKQIPWPEFAAGVERFEAGRTLRVQLKLVKSKSKFLGRYGVGLLWEVQIPIRGKDSRWLGAVVVRPEGRNCEVGNAMCQPRLNV